MILFFSPTIESDLLLPETEARHCLKVLRMQQGDVIRVTDGKGKFFKAEIEDARPVHCRLRILETEIEEKGWRGRIEIALAPTKNIDRTEWFAEKATEAGIDKISFLKCHHSERRELRGERMEKVLTSAMKQSLKARLPELQGMTDFNRFVEQNFDGQKFIAHCYPETKPLLSTACRKDENILILIGPEGDFSPEEVALAKEKGFQPVSLGSGRLRTETAALTACLTVHIANQLK